MQLPDLLDQNFRRLGGLPPREVVRALYDLDGGLGATWLALGEDSLVFYHRPSGGEFNRTRFRMNEVIECQPTTDGTHACLRFRFANANFTLKCSLFDQPRLESVARACTAYEATNPIEAPARLTPASAFCAGIHAVLDADGHVDPVETEWLCRTLPDSVAIEQGSAWYRVHGCNELLQALPIVLRPEQRECLLVNQLSAIMSDGLLEPSEVEIIERFRAAMEISPERHEEFFRVILSRNQMAVLQSGSDDSALDTFAACLLALTRCESEKSASEEHQLHRVLNDTTVLARAEAILAAGDLETSASRVAALTPDQAHTLVTNLLALAMADGEITASEQQFVDSIRTGTGLAAAEYQSCFKVLLTKHNLGVLSV